jgi:hypothetical protein
MSLPALQRACIKLHVVCGCSGALGAGPLFDSVGGATWSWFFSNLVRFSASARAALESTSRAVIMSWLALLSARM